MIDLKDKGLKLRVIEHIAKTEPNFFYNSASVEVKEDGSIQFLWWNTGTGSCCIKPFMESDAVNSHLFINYNEDKYNLYELTSTLTHKDKLKFYAYLDSVKKLKSSKLLTFLYRVDIFIIAVVYFIVSGVAAYYLKS